MPVADAVATATQTPEATMFSPTHPATDFLYVESDIPPGVGLREWRREHPEPPSRRRRIRAKVLAAVALDGHRAAPVRFA
jgi:hypothetical protein